MGAKSVKRIISLILSVLLCAAMVPAAFAGREDLIFRDARSDFSEEFSTAGSQMHRLLVRTRLLH